MIKPVQEIQILAAVIKPVQEIQILAVNKSSKSPLRQSSSAQNPEVKLRRTKIFKETFNFCF